MKATWHTHEANAPHRSARWAMSDRGWLFVGKEELCRGHYLDYGQDHYRSPHQYCCDTCHCELSRPGKVHAVCVKTKESSYFQTVAQAKTWIESKNPDITVVIEKFRNIKIAA